MAQCGRSVWTAVGMPQAQGTHHQPPPRDTASIPLHTGHYRGMDVVVVWGQGGCPPPPPPARDDEMMTMTKIGRTILANFPHF